MKVQIEKDIFECYNTNIKNNTKEFVLWMGKKYRTVAGNGAIVWTDLAVNYESSLGGGKQGKTKYNVEYDSINEFNGEYPILDNTIFKKTGGSYWICGENVGTEKKVVHGAVADYTDICIHEFYPYELSTNE